MARQQKNGTVIIPLLFILLLAPDVTFCGDTSREFWPETDVWLRFDPDWRASMFIALSKNLETHYREGNLILQVDYAWGKTRRLHLIRLYDENRAREMKSILFRGGYLGGRSLDDRGDAYEDHIAFMELHLRTPYKGNVLVSHRVRPELRWLGDDHSFSTRFRYRLMIEKEYKSGYVSFVPYVNVEPYYDSRYSTVNRVRLIGGTSVGWSSYYAVEVNITYQYDSRSSITHVYALNMILHVFFHTESA